MNLRSTLSNLYPEGSIGGECGLFVRTRLADINPVGDSYTEKKKTVDRDGIRVKQLDGQFRVGDVLITSEGTNWLGMGYGHVAFVNEIIGNYLYLTESNFKNDKRITHNRALDKKSSKIYGVIRRPFKFKFAEEPLTLNISLFMNHDKQWKTEQLNALTEWFKVASKGKLLINLFPLYTYYALKDWWYQAYGDFSGNFYNVVSKDYIDKKVIPLPSGSGNTKNHFILWCIAKKQWQGSVIDSQMDELGWYYINSKPGVATIACDETDKSPFYNEPAFVHFARHELCHFLMNYGNRQGLDLTHDFDFQAKDLSKVFDWIEWDYLKANI